MTRSNGPPSKSSATLMESATTGYTFGSPKRLAACVILATFTLVRSTATTRPVPPMRLAAWMAFPPGELHMSRMASPGCGASACATRLDGKPCSVTSCGRTPFSDGRPCTRSVRFSAWPLPRPLAGSPNVSARLCRTSATPRKTSLPALQSSSHPSWSTGVPRLLYISTASPYTLHRPPASKLIGAAATPGAYGSAPCRTASAHNRPRTNAGRPASGSRPFLRCGGNIIMSLMAAGIIALAASSGPISLWLASISSTCSRGRPACKFTRTPVAAGCSAASWNRSSRAAG
mmetsp:Transcript_36829/g.93071  ORF Transcript_36829/g.93071 Transcript_36829/m.93071 type:complete len:289 (-) Transcript_36829:95-961(-)